MSQRGHGRSNYFNKCFFNLGHIQARFHIINIETKGQSSSGQILSRMRFLVLPSTSPISCATKYAIDWCCPANLWLVRWLRTTDASSSRGAMTTTWIRLWVAAPPHLSLYGVTLIVNVKYCMNFDDLLALASRLPWFFKNVTSQSKHYSAWVSDCCLNSWLLQSTDGVDGDRGWLGGRQSLILFPRCTWHHLYRSIAGPTTYPASI